MSDELREGGDLPLDELRAAWSRLQPPSAGADDEAGRDDVTRASLDWMRAAWRTLEAPAPDLAGLRRHLRARTRRRLAEPLWSLAAVLALALGSWFVLQRPGAGPRTPHMDQPLLAFDSSPVAALDAEHLELRSGPVRLVLFTNTPDLESHEN